MTKYQVSSVFSFLPHPDWDLDLVHKSRKVLKDIFDEGASVIKL